MGCLTGPDHAGTQLHGFLAYLMKRWLCERIAGRELGTYTDGSRVGDHIWYVSDVTRAPGLRCRIELLC